MNMIKLMRNENAKETKLTRMISPSKIESSSGCLASNGNNALYLDFVLEPGASVNQKKYFVISKNWSPVIQ